MNCEPINPKGGRLNVYYRLVVSATVRRSAQRFRLRVLRWLCALCALAVVALLAPPSSGAAQAPPPVRLEIQAGYGGSYRLNQWFPITVVASNDGPDLSAVLEWRFLGNEGNVFQREIDLPRGSRKQVTLYAYSTAFQRSGELRLLAERAEVSRERVQIEPVDASLFLIGVVSSDPVLLNSLAAMQFQQMAGAQVTRLAEEQLPEQGVLLAGLNVIFLHDNDTAGLTPLQRAALRLWVELGGQLVVGGGANADRTTAGLADLLPVTVEGLAGNAPLTGLARLAGGANPDDLPPTTVNRVTLKPGAADLDGDQLLVSHNIGAGRVIFSAFDLSALRGWRDEPLLWERVFEVDGRFDPAASYRWQGNDIVRAGLQLPALQLPSFWVLLLYVIVYIGMVGPLNFLILRRLRRVELAWLTIPATVLVFVVGTYGVSLLVRGSEPLISQITVVQSVEAAPTSQATAFIGVFSPRRAQYTLNLGPETMVSKGGFFNQGAASQTPLVWTDSATEVRDALVDVSSLRTFVAEQPIGSAPRVASRLQRDPLRIQGEVINQGDEPLLDALLVSGDNVQPLGAIAPGATRSVALPLGMGNFPGGDNAATEGLFNRQNILANLFGFNQFGLNIMAGPNPLPLRQGMIERDGVYLLAWRDQPLLDLRINGDPVNQQGLTLYVIRLND